MQYISHYASPLGELLIAADDIGLTGLWFAGQKYYARGLDTEHEERESLAIASAKHWLDVYFAGQQPDFTPPLHLVGTAFQTAVWDILLTVPYGETLTYGEIAARIAAQQGRGHMSAQAIGGAVGRNPVSIIVPCHRIVGKSGDLTGYAAGVEKKTSLLRLENAALPVLARE